MRAMSRAALLGLFLWLTAACRGPPAPLQATPPPGPDTRPALLQPGALSPRIANYEIQAEYDTKAHKVTATETLHWKNTRSAPVANLALHLYMNAFKNEDSVFMKESRGRHRRAERKK